MRSASRLLVFAAAMLLSRAAAAFECTKSRDNQFVSIHWPVRALKYAIRAPGPSTIQPATAQTLIDQAFAAWSTPRCTDITFTSMGVVPAETDPQQVSQVIFYRDSWEPREPTAVALTTMTYGTTDGVIRHGVVEVNETLFQFADVQQGGGCLNMNSYDLGAVVTHEAGHFLGLAHSSTELVMHLPTDPTMTAMVDPCDSNFRTLEPDDIEGLCFIYPVGSAEARGCLTLPAQKEPYVSNKALGCSASEGHGGTPVMLLAWAVFGAAITLRRRR